VWHAAQLLEPCKLGERSKHGQVVAAARLDHACCLTEAGLYLEAASVLASFFAMTDQIFAGGDSEAGPEVLHLYMVTPDAALPVGAEGGSEGGSDAGNKRAVGLDSESHQEDGIGAANDTPTPLLQGVAGLPEFARIRNQDARVLRDVRLHKLGSNEGRAFVFEDDKARVDVAMAAAGRLLPLPIHSSEGSPSLSPDSALNWRFTCLDELVQSGRCVLMNLGC